MGNTPSQHTKSGSATPAGSTHGQQSPASSAVGSATTPPSERRREPKLRDNIHSQRGAPPESSQVQARGQTSTHRPRPSRSHSPQRPQSQPAPFSQTAHSQQQYQSQNQNQYAPQSQFQSPYNAPLSNSTNYTSSGKEVATGPKPPHVPVTSQQQPAKPQSGASPSVPSHNRVKSSPTPPTSSTQSTKPVAVPQATQPIPTAEPPKDSRAVYSTSLSHQASVQPDEMSYLTRPPRLPLPIEEEIHTPGSPILGPADADARAPLPELDPLEVGETLARPLSAMSNSDDDEDNQELITQKDKPGVPTLFTWHGKETASKAYVTGTPFQWSRKHKLFPVQGKPGYFQNVIAVVPGTHHIRFIIDGEMSLSPDLPTTVDFGNNLVNYIEVSADDMPGNRSKQQERSTPTASSTQDSQHEDTETSEQEQKPQRTKPVLGSEHYSSTIPQYLIDLDKAEDSPEYRYAAMAIQKLPQPPSLPGFLAKPILNAATPMKDDNSVLNMPNHTVLNHLATSSIKGNVLAVSATTRYKRKYVTTIMYKPTSDDTS